MNTNPNYEEIKRLVIDINVELEKANFKHAAKSLVDIWDGEKIAGYKINASFCPIPDDQDKHEKMLQEEFPELNDFEWRAKHVIQSHYMLQIVKCKDTSCCKEIRCNKLFDIIPQGFIPSPICINYDGKESLRDLRVDGQKANYDDKYMTFFENVILRSSKEYQVQSKLDFQCETLPFDYQLPSMTLRTLHNRTCETCGYYSTSMVNKAKHKAACHRISGNVSTDEVLATINETEKETLTDYFHDFDSSLTSETKLVAIRERNHRDDREVYCTYGMASAWVPFPLVPPKSMDDMRKVIKERRKQKKADRLNNEATKDTAGCESIPDFVNINTLENFWTLNMDVPLDHWRPWE
eukprot:Pgem_evm1s3865